jgi:hypothetical protein
MAETLTDIANLALVSIAKDPINSIDDIAENTNASSPTTNSAAICRINIYETIKRIQARLRWSNLWTNVLLGLKYSPGDEDPITGITYAQYVYNYPTNVLAFAKLRSEAPFTTPDQTLMTNDPAPILGYVRYSDNPSEWNTYLTDAIWTDLAMRIAPLLTTATSGHTARATQLAMITLKDSAAAEVTNRSSDVEMGQFFDFNQARIGRDGGDIGIGQKYRLRSNSRRTTNWQEL